MCARIETVRLPRARSWAQAWLGIGSRVPSQVSFYHSASMRERVARLCEAERYDAIFVQLFRMAPFVADLDHPGKILFLADSIALSLERSKKFEPPWKRPMLEWERRRVAAFELAMSRAFRECWVLSEVDRAHLAARGCANAKVVTHGVDESLFDLERPAPVLPRAVFLGNLSVPHNVDAACFLARQIWPRVHRAMPNAELELAGAEPRPRVLALGEMPGVRVSGPLENVADLWKRATVMVAPLRFSAGIQNKVLEAMAAGVPTVTTPQVAEAIGARDGDTLRVGADDDALARAVLDILRDPDSSRDMTVRARALVRERFTWDSMVSRLEDIARRNGGSE
ncbi:MAG TPA: glycosyltransferase [Candidatus Saccharimonadaceae bacterium]|nr:glycosyltransferase [Candidatus Saccharimonadaceae bacterium]